MSRKINILLERTVQRLKRGVAAARFYSNTSLAVTDFNENAQYVSAVYNKDNATVGYFEVGTWMDATNFTSRSGTYIMTTGALQKANVCNIYDMAGNLWEWTMEGNYTTNRVIRGESGNNRPVIDRDGYLVTDSHANKTFRPSLYIK